MSVNVRIFFENRYAVPYDECEIFLTGPESRSRATAACHLLKAILNFISVSTFLV